MKKIVLALVVALGCANVYAGDVVAPKQDDATLKTFNTEVNRSVEALKLSKADQNVVMTWIKKHPVLVGTIAAAALVTIVGGVSWYYGTGTFKSKDKDGKEIDVTKTAENSKMAWIWSWYTKPFNFVKEKGKAGKDWVVAHPKTSITAGLGVIGIAAAIYDIAARGEQSTLKALWKKATAEANKAQAPAQPATAA